MDFHYDSISHDADSFIERRFIGQIISKFFKGYFIRIHGIESSELSEFLFIYNFNEGITRTVTIRNDLLNGYHVLQQEDVPLTAGFFWMSDSYKRDSYKRDAFMRMCF